MHLPMMTCDATRHIFNPYVLFGRPRGQFNSVKIILHIKGSGWYFSTFPNLLRIDYEHNFNLRFKNSPLKNVHHFCLGLTDPRYKTRLHVMNFTCSVLWHCTNKLLPVVYLIWFDIYFFIRITGININHISKIACLFYDKTEG